MIILLKRYIATHKLMIRDRKNYCIYSCLTKTEQWRRFLDKLDITCLLYKRKGFVRFESS